MVVYSQNVGSIVAYLAFGPLRVNPSPLWQPVAPNSGPIRNFLLPYARVLANLEGVAPIASVSSFCSLACLTLWILQHAVTCQTHHLLGRYLVCALQQCTLNTVGYSQSAISNKLTQI